MLIELVSLFVVPVLYCGYMEAKLTLGARSELAGAVPVNSFPLETTDV